MPLVIYGMGGIECGLEYDSSRNFARNIFIIVPGADNCIGSCAIVP